MAEVITMELPRSILVDSMQPVRRVMSWHLDKKLMIGMIAALILNTFTVAWWASGITKDVADLSALPTEIRLIQDDIIRLKARTQFEEGILGELKSAVKDLTSTVQVINNNQATIKAEIHAVKEEHKKYGK